MGKKHLLYLYFCFFLFQNCAPFEAIDSDAIYPYSSQPVFFSDFKLVKTEVDTEDRELFVFDFVVSYAANPGENVGYRIDFSTIALTGVCSFVEGVVNNQNSHNRVQCKLPIDDDLYVRIMYLGVNQETEEKEFRF